MGLGISDTYLRDIKVSKKYLCDSSFLLLLLQKIFLPPAIAPPPPPEAHEHTHHRWGNLQPLPHPSRRVVSHSVIFNPYLLSLLSLPCRPQRATHPPASIRGWMHSPREMASQIDGYHHYCLLEKRKKTYVHLPSQSTLCSLEYMSISISRIYDPVPLRVCSSLRLQCDPVFDGSQLPL